MRHTFRPAQAVTVFCIALTAVVSPPAMARQEYSSCLGDIHPPRPGLVEAQNPELLKSALGSPQNGKLCTGKVFKVTGTGATAVTVYRVWDATKPYTEWGSWWSFNAPQGQREIYRRDNEICPDWSALNQKIRCTLKVGTEIVVGTGQSAKCSESLTYPVSPVNQVYIPNNAQSNQIYVEHCTEEGPWPTTAP